MEEPILFQIHVKARDLWHFNMYHVNRGVLGVFNLIFTAAAVAVLVIGWGSFSLRQRLALMFCALIFTVIQPLLLFYKALRRARQPGMKEPMLLSFDREGLKVRQLAEEAVFTWEDIGGIVKQPTMMMIYMDRIHAYLLPKALYEGNKEAFFSLLRDHMPKERLKGV